MRKSFVLLMLILLLPAASLHAQETETAWLRVANFSDTEVMLDVNNGTYQFTVMPGEISDYLEVGAADLAVGYSYATSAGFSGLTLTAGSRVSLLFYPSFSFGEPSIENAFVNESAPAFTADLASVTFIDAREIGFDGTQPDFSFLSLRSGDTHFAISAETTDAFGEPDTVFVQPGQYTLEIYVGLAETPIGESLTAELGAENVVIVVTGTEGMASTAAIYTLPQ